MYAASKRYNVVQLQEPSLVAVVTIQFRCRLIVAVAIRIRTAILKPLYTIQLAYIKRYLCPTAGVLQR